MGISSSLVFIAAGAILKWAVTATVVGRRPRDSRRDPHGRRRRRSRALADLLVELRGGFGASNTTTTVARDEPTIYR